MSNVTGEGEHRTTEEPLVGLYSHPREPDRLRQLIYSQIGDLAIVEGDIVIGTTAQMRAYLANGALDAAVGQGIGIEGERFRWPQGRIAYQIADDLPRPERVRDAIAHWEARTPIRFLERTSANASQPQFRDYLSFEDQGGCWSYVGRQGGRQALSLGARCSTGNAIHEIGHAVGLWHEQSREDRDAHVMILRENIKPAALHNFDQHILDGEDLGTYDYGSIMHYPKRAFSRNGQPTILPRQDVPIGQRDGLSDGDIAAVRRLYPGS